jgi:hypothetical protein
LGVDEELPPGGRAALAGRHPDANARWVGAMKKGFALGLPS